MSSHLRRHLQEWLAVPWGREPTECVRMKRGVGRARVWAGERGKERRILRNCRGLASSKSSAWASRVETRGRTLEKIPKVVSWQNSLSWGSQTSFGDKSLSLSIWLAEAIQAMKANLFYSKSTDLNINFVSKHLHKKIRNNVWPNMWAFWLAKLTYKIKHQ